MRAAPAILLLIVGAAVCGGVLELLLPGSGRQTMGFDEAIATLGAWLLDRFMSLARSMKNR